MSFMLYAGHCFRWSLHFRLWFLLGFGFSFSIPPDFLNSFAVRLPFRQGRGSIGRERITIIPSEVCRCQREVLIAFSTRKNIAFGYRKTRYRYLAILYLFSFFSDNFSRWQLRELCYTGHGRKAKIGIHFHFDNFHSPEKSIIDKSCLIYKTEKFSKDMKNSLKN